MENRLTLSGLGRTAFVTEKLKAVYGDAVHPSLLTESDNG